MAAENDTRQKILDAAFICFSENGYVGTNMREIAESIGFTKAALYKHFESKDQIWNEMLDKIESYYISNMGSEQNLPPIPETLEAFEENSRRMVDFTLNDPTIIRVRKLLQSEQFHNERACKLSSEHFLLAKERMFSTIFKELIKKGLLKKDDPKLLAFEYSAPISALIIHSDREPEQKTEIRKKIIKFTKHFLEMHKNEK